MKTLKIGQSYNFTVSGADGSTIPPGTLVATSNRPSSVGVTVNSNNTGTVTALAVSSEEGPATVSYTAPGYTSTTEQVMVIALPLIVVTDGAVS